VRVVAGGGVEAKHRGEKGGESEGCGEGVVGARTARVLFGSRYEWGGVRGWIMWGEGSFAHEILRMVWRERQKRQLDQKGGKLYWGKEGTKRQEKKVEEHGERTSQSEVFHWS